MWKVAGIVVVLLLAGVLIFAATKPGVFKVERKTAIKAPPEKVFALINDFKAWGVWSPWETKDPAMKRSFGKLTAGKGATYAWEGNKAVGQGTMEMTRSTPSVRILIDLNFIKPFVTRNIVEFTLEAKGDITTVNWSMVGPANYLNKLMSIFVSMDKMIGPDFEAGLANLKAAAEK